jgi:hypothetical protein
MMFHTQGGTRFTQVRIHDIITNILVNICMGSYYNLVIIFKTECQVRHLLCSPKCMTSCLYPILATESKGSLYIVHCTRSK